MPTTLSESKPLVAVVFSKDRPLQLDATLASLLLRCVDPERMEVNVLYTTSSAYQEGLYRQLSLEYPGVVFRRERHFREDVLALVAGAPNISLPSRLLNFFERFYCRWPFLVSLRFWETEPPWVPWRLWAHGRWDQA